MATVTIGRPYFDALLRRAELHAPTQHVKYGTELYSNVTISKAEHDYMVQALREYHLLKSALFRGGLTVETLDTLLQDEGTATNEEPSGYDYESETTPVRARSRAFASTEHDQYAFSQDVHSAASPHQRLRASGEPGTFAHGPESQLDDDEDDQTQSPSQLIPLHAQRTVLITNLPERTSHKDLASIVRGGRLLDIFLRNDRSATISFVEGASEFLAYAKRNDIYLHTKRLEFRWNDRQFHVPSHVSTKIANGATRNLVVRNIAGKITADQIRDHLDHIHNLVVVHIYFKNGDAHISTNSIHNALFARTCMMSRTAYKGARIEYYPDECAQPLPQPTKAYAQPQRTHVKTAPLVNQYALLDIGSDDESESDEDSYGIHGVQVGGCRLPNGRNMAPIVKVAVIQLYPKPLQPEQNFTKAETFIRSAAAQGAELAVLPEYHLTNWKPKDPEFLAVVEKCSDYVKKYQKLAKECGICIVPGTIVESHKENEKEQDRLLNVCYFIDHQGNIAGKYIKKNLWGPEREHLTGSGRDLHEVFDTPVGKVGLLICWDLAFPEAFRELIAQGAKIIIIPTFWTLNDCNEAGLQQNPAAEALFLNSILTARAFENTCAVIFANAGGPPGKGYAGLSQVTVPFVGPLTKLGGSAEGMSVVDIDMQVLEDAEANYQVRADLAKDDWHYDYRHGKGPLGRGKERL
ncbi:carbon-nitrogen hydrolase [Bipolaris maydis]|nr:carbon-nitrogen hydrolase [Bipolaris maydis]KAJ5024800.1 carbon-nitrogen hydrolase [Bipolaris maydis]